MAFSEDLSAWDAFLAQWPLERLRTMSLAEYTQAGDKNCFTYWMEGGLDQHGSIWGGSAFKFGIYSRNDTAPKAGDGSRAYDGQYGWYRQFGETAQEAFEAVREEVVRIAEAARRGEFERVDDSRLGPAYRWKIAFHYQDRDAEHLIPCVFQRKPLLYLCGHPQNDNSIPLSMLYRDAARHRQAGESLMAFSRRVWRDWALSTPLRITLTESAVRNGYLPLDLLNAPFPDSIAGGATDAESGDPVCFRTDSGMEFESDVRVGSGTAGRLRRRLGSYYQSRNVRPGDVIQVEPDDEDGFLITHIPKGAPPPAPRVQESAPAAAIQETSEHMAKPINRILYGPPGTGKTYHTVNEALDLLDPEFKRAHEDDRAALKARFDELAAAQRIRFVTFHQSFSYEDFVEGIRADSEGGELQYRVEPGVFREICEAARSRAVADADDGIDISGRRIWKISLGDANTEGHVFDECMKEGIALLGFGFGADFSGVDSREAILHRIQQANEEVGAGDYAITALNTFIRKVRTGDLLVVTHGNLAFRAIGEVTGEYFHREQEEGEHYVQARPVRWLREYAPPRPYGDLMENRFSQMTIYELRPGSISLERLADLLAPGRSDAGEPEARVLIIDEINRGNVSRIFGELITLIEPSKREGAEEALKVTLPYSKESFSVPRNVHIIGTMNTADRSLAGLDVALRRRFEFREMMPDTGALAGVAVAGIPVDRMLETMNQRIEVLLGRDFMIGHAYFMGLKGSGGLDDLARIFRRQVLPLLQEYFFEDWEKIALVLNDHRKASEDRFVRERAAGLEALFGAEVDVPRGGSRWEVNNAAFARADAYRGIIEVASAPA